MSILQILVAITILALVLVIGGGTLTWFFERSEATANLNNLPDALWWAVTTMTTVGYGDHYPVSIAGRLVATVIMVGGVAIIGGVAAAVAFAATRRLMVSESEEVEEAFAETRRGEVGIEQTLLRLEQRLVGLEMALEELADGTADKVGTTGPPAQGRSTPSSRHRGPAERHPTAEWRERLRRRPVNVKAHRATSTGQGPRISTVDRDRSGTKSSEKLAEHRLTVAPEPVDRDDDESDSGPAPPGGQAHALHAGDQVRRAKPA